MKVLITGSTGLLAKGFEETMPEAVELVGIHKRDYAVKDTRMSHLQLDCSDESAVNDLFSAHRFDAVIHAAGMASVDQVERHPEQGRASNIGGTTNIARAAKRSGAYMVYISTNAVFDGDNAPYSEEAPTAPLHHYGRIKLACEEVVAEHAGDHCVARPILMYGWHHAVNRPNPVTWIYEKLLKGEAVKLVDDVWENPLYNIQCGRTLWSILEKRPSGIFHLAGGEKVNRWELGIRVASVFGLDQDLIERVDSSAFPAIAKRPKDTSFVTKKVEEELGITPLSMTEGLEAMKASMGVGI